MGRSPGSRSRCGGGRPPTRACAGSTLNAAGLDVSDRRRQRAGGRRSRSRGRRRRACCARSATGRHRRAEVLPHDARRDRRRAGRTSRAPDTPAISATRSGCPGNMPSTCGMRSSAGGRAHDVHPAGMLALDVARIEAGLLLIDVDFHGSKKCLIEAQRYTPYEMGLGRLVSRAKGPFVGRAALARRTPHRPEAAGRRPRDLDGTPSKSLYGASGCRRRSPTTASRVAGAGVRGRPAGRPRHEHHLVAHPQAVHRARDDRSRRTSRPAPRSTSRSPSRPSATG